KSSTDSSKSVAARGYEQAIDLLHRCNTEHGFLATPTDRDNYRRIWGRDGSIISLAALLTDDTDLETGCRHTLETLVRHQGPHGEIPSNVDPATNRVSYGGTAGRVDANLWFVLACSEYWRKTGDDDFLDRMVEPLEKVRFLLGAWEFNTRGLLYIPPTGDWADEYLQSGYVLYDQVLYYQALKQFCCLHRHLHDTDDHELTDRVSRLRSLIRTNYWFCDDDDIHDDGDYIYHKVLYEKGREAAPKQAGSFWMPFFSPFGYGYRFDAMANVLISLFDIADESQEDTVDKFIEAKIVDEKAELLPAFWPVITPKDEKWDDLQMSFAHTFKNQPHEYHNGGLWPLISGFYVASLARRGQSERAERYRKALHRANRLEMKGRDWSFPEFVHGKKHKAGGTHPMGWSAGAAIIAEKYVRGSRLFGESAE
ncbi:MAG TPA: glycoside hydrolase 100 family protein, partial [Opitutales bacterium]|nr:glycoside hydrolase 100 family protein [Opitutales bacterium]